MKRLIAIALIIFPAVSFAQVTIAGKVLNQADTRPLANVSVFLNNTAIGITTETDGSFAIKNVKPGKYDVVVSIIGFEKYDQPIIVTNSNITLPDILIFPKTTLLNEVRIKSIPDADREKYYNLFKDEFLGTSNLAKDCTIVNPEILELNYDKKTDVLTASSDDFLIIENETLGYKIKYLLTNFSLNNGPSAKLHLSYAGSVLFEQIKGTPAQQKRREKRREEVYEPSLTHFLRSALNDRIDQEGFWVLLLKRNNTERPSDSVIEAKIKFYKKLKSEGSEAGDSLSFWLKKDKLPKTTEKLLPDPLNKNDIIKPTDQQGVFALGAGNDKDALFITYSKRHNFQSNWQPSYLNGLNNIETTIVDFDTRYAFFDSNGALFNPNSLILSGVWGRYRVAELLPVDYEPPANTNNESEANGPNVTGYAQSDPLTNDLKKLQAATDSLVHDRPSEKMYLQFDKSYYALGDTIWFKAYVLNDFLAASGKSRIINIDLVNDSNKVIKRYKVPVENGLGWGNISLDEKDGFAAGTYTIRAYTNWMRNFGDDDFFYKSIYVSGATQNSFLVNTWFSTSSVNGVNVVSANLLFSDINKLPFAAAPLQLDVISGSKRLYRQKLQTGVDGKLNINFNIPDKSSGLAIVAENEQKTKKAVIPVHLNRPENTDIQFLPEGGSLVAGLPAHIGFKAISEDGKGIDVSGIVTDHSNREVARFKSLHNGMGSFDLVVDSGEVYTAKVTLPGGALKEYVLPAIKNTGMVLKVKNPMKSDSVTVTVAATNNSVQSAGNYFLIGKARGIVCYAAVFNFNRGNSIQKKIAKSLFPTGITHFTILTVKYEPLNERLVYIDHPDALNIKVTVDKGVYDKRDSVALSLKVTDGDGDPVSGNFSMAVTDDVQVKNETDAENIATRFLLTSDLKGYVEQPGYYLPVKSPEAWQALDNLLLTQGGIGYDWAQVFNPPAFVYQPRNDMDITGHVTNVLNKPVKGTDIMLFSNKPSLLIDTATDINGRFVFDRLPRVDTPVFVLKAVNKKGKSFNVNVNVDEVAPPVFTKPFAPAIAPWYVNADSTLLFLTKNASLIKKQQDFAPGGHMLKEVNIKAGKIIKDSENLNGSGNADFVMDENDLEAAGKKTWLQVLQENVKGFREGASSPGVLSYYVYYKLVRIFVDGIELDSAITMPLTPKILNEKEFLEWHNAEDIKGIELNFSPKYADSYELRFGGTYAFIEITTRSGSGPFLGNTPGMYLYKPLPISWPKQFYKPKYNVADTLNRLDLRSTIDWEPNIVTDAGGEAKIWFYAADQPSTYTITIEGTDLNGRIGYKQSAITVEAKQKAK